VALDAASPLALRPQGSMPPARPPPAAVGTTWRGRRRTRRRRFDDLRRGPCQPSRHAKAGAGSTMEDPKGRGKAVCLLFIVAGWKPAEAGRL